jgi:hypothetical protein
MAEGNDTRSLSNLTCYFLSPSHFQKKIIRETRLTREVASWLLKKCDVVVEPTPVNKPPLYNEISQKS